MRVATESYETQRSRWPASGPHILAHYDDRTIVVYQAYQPAIAKFAVKHQRFGGHSFSFERMCWVKPNSLRMMYRLAPSRGIRSASRVPDGGRPLA
jgi:hypothetical protein